MNTHTHLQRRTGMTALFGLAVVATLVAQAPTAVTYDSYCKLDLETRRTGAALGPKRRGARRATCKRG